MAEPGGALGNMHCFMGYSIPGDVALLYTAYFGECSTTGHQGSPCMPKIHVHTAKIAQVIWCSKRKTKWSVNTGEGVLFCDVCWTCSTACIHAEGY